MMNRISAQTAKSLFLPAIKFNHPVLVASYRWRIVADQLKDLLGNEVYRQWFENITPMYITNNVLILRSRDRRSCTWITTNYQDLLDVLLSFQDGQLSCFITTEEDLPLRPLDLLEVSGAVS
jgi:hypothetical protein